MNLFTIPQGLLLEGLLVGVMLRLATRPHALEPRNYVHTCRAIWTLFCLQFVLAALTHA